jgi:hypothetical protein
MLVCPYCGKPNEIPVDAAYDSIEAGPLYQRTLQ